MGKLLLSGKNEVKEELTEGIFLARVGPMLEKYWQNFSAIITGSVINLPSALNIDVIAGLLFRLFMISLINFNVDFKSFFVRSNFPS